MRNLVRNLVLALLAVSGLALASVVPAKAIGSHYPFCLQGDEYPALSNCTFSSYQQCQATASGRFLQCMENPYYIPGGNRGRGRARSFYPAY